MGAHEPEVSQAMAQELSVSDRLGSLRAAIKAQQLGAVIVPSSDPHMSEYPPAHWAAREWLSGFTGSVGTLVVTLAEAALWVDSRYWEQAAHQLEGSAIQLIKQGHVAAPSIEVWLGARLPPGSSVLADGAVLAWSEAQRLRDVFAAHGLTLRTELDVLSALWRTRPLLPKSAIFEQPTGFAGETRQAKLERLRQAMSAHGANHCLLSSLDDIAWLFNLRGEDVDYNPVFVAHALIDARKARLFMDETKVPVELRARLVLEGVRIEPYTRVADVIAALPPDACLLFDPERVSTRLVEAIPDERNRVEATSPVLLMKSRKNLSEQGHVRVAMEHDGAALCRFMSWFDSAQHTALTETSVAARVAMERARNPEFLGASFATICAFEANAAQAHYQAHSGSAATIRGNGLLLLDSGGQYRGATTDITRMLPVGVPTPAQKRDCALVLRGVIALSRAAFPASIAAPMVDALARAPLWAEGIDYGHGTGHGVGCFLHVHEGPQSISCYGKTRPHNTLEDGMITSIEPGIYRPGRWGVRIENLVLARPSRNTEFGNFLEFETLTLCPIDLRCIDISLLRADEIAWLDAYHEEVRRRLEPLLTGHARDWMRARTSAVSTQSA
jgi:Xaa-Pro aminopeptidase